MNKKRIFGILLFVVLGLFIYTLANPRNDEEDLKKENGNTQVEQQEVEPTPTNPPVEPVVNVVNDEEQPVVIINIDKLQTAINTGNNLLNSSKGSTDTELNNLLKQLADEVLVGNTIIESQTKTQAQVDTQTTTIENLIISINDHMKTLFDGAQKLVDEQKNNNTKENIDKALEAVNVLPDGDKKKEMLDEVKDITAPVITVKSESTKFENAPYFTEVSFELTDNYSLKEIEVNGTAYELMHTITDNFDKVSVNNVSGVYGENTVILRDLAGNETTYKFILDNKTPVITEIEEDGVYMDPVTPVITEDYLKTITLNGNSFTNGSSIEEVGSYTLVVTDKAGNETTVSFKIAKKITITKQLSNELKQAGYSFANKEDKVVEYAKDSYKLTNFVCVNNNSSDCSIVMWKDSKGNIVSKLNNTMAIETISTDMNYTEDETFTAYLYPSIVKFNLEEVAINNGRLLDDKNENAYSFDETATSRTYYYTESTKLTSFPKVICDKCTYEVYDKQNNLVSVNNNDVVTPINTDHVINGTEVYTIKVIERFDITFKDYKGNVIKTQRVSDNSQLVAPTVKDYTARDISYTFNTWDKDLTKVTTDTVVTATYKITGIKANVYELLVGDIPSDGKFVGKTSDYSKSLAKVSIKLTDDVLTTTTKNKSKVLVLGTDKVLTYVKDINELPTAKEGYSFNWYVLKYEKSDGWHIDSKQIINSYKVVFKDVNGTLSEQTIEYGKSATAPNVAEYTINGITYEFDKWNKDFLNIKDNTEVTAIYKVTKVVAKVFEKSTYLTDIELNLNSDVLSAISSNQNANISSTAILSTVKGTLPTAKEGYSFNWNSLTYNTTTGWSIVGEQVKNTFKVTFKDYDGKVLDTQDVAYKESATAPIAPTREGNAQYSYTFKGWDKNFSSITTDTVVTATYKQNVNSYTVKFVTNLGTTVATQNVKYGSDAKLPKFDNKITINTVKYVYATVADNYKNITGETTVIVTYKLADKAEFNAYLIYSIFDAPEDGNPDSVLKYHRVLSSEKLEIVDDSYGSLAKVVIEANNSTTHEAVLALGANEIDKYLHPGTVKKLAKAEKHMGLIKYDINWYVLKYNAKDKEWHLDGEKVYY